MFVKEITADVGSEYCLKCLENLITWVGLGRITYCWSSIELMMRTKRKNVY